MLFRALAPDVDAGGDRMALNGAYEHRKTRRLARAIGLDPWAALGLMEAFWAWARKAARDGRIEADQWEDVADYLRWRQPATELARLLEDSEFVDAMEGWWWIHDWDQHADDTVRKALERSGKSFANRADPRQWKKDGSPKAAKSSPEVHRIEEKVRVTARARPEPEPEPEPEPAAAAAESEASAAAPAATPPLAEENSTDLAGISGLLRAVMPMGTPPPDAAIVRQVATAMQGGTLSELSAAIARYRRRGKAPNSYGFWPIYVQDAMSPTKRPTLGAIREPAEAPKEQQRPICPLCGSSGVLGPQPEEPHANGVKAALRAGGRICACEKGQFWAEWLGVRPDSGTEGLTAIQRNPLAVAL